MVVCVVVAVNEFGWLVIGGDVLAIVCVWWVVGGGVVVCVVVVVSLINLGGWVGWLWCSMVVVHVINGAVAVCVGWWWGCGCIWLAVM